MVRVSTQGTGTLYRCETCDLALGDKIDANAHRAKWPRHKIGPLFEVRREKV